MSKGKIYVMGMDQMVLPLTKHFIEERSVPALAKFFARSAYGQALASFPCWTPNNWAAISTGAQSGTHGASSWFMLLDRPGSDTPGYQTPSGARAGHEL